MHRNLFTAATATASGFEDPSILATNLSLFFRRKIVRNVKDPPNLLRTLSGNLISDALASSMEQIGDFQVISRHYKLKQQIQIQIIHELTFPIFKRFLC